MKRWTGSISIAIYLKSKEEEEYLNDLQSKDYFHKAVTISHYLSQSPLEYPYNRLRNIAISKVKTSHFLVMDMDMWPSDNLYSTLKNLDSRFLNDEYLAIVIPSFSYRQLLSKCNDFEVCVKKLNISLSIIL